MSEHIARQTLMRLNLNVVAVAAHQTTLMADLSRLAQADAIKEHEAFLQRRSDLCAAFGLPPAQQSKPFAFSNGVAVIPVHGTLINRFGSSWGYVTGYNFIRSQVAAAGLDPDVQAIVFDGNSYGGEAAGCFECAADIPRLANGKPTLFAVDSNCYSACYALASQCDQIVCTPSGGVGSVGVVAMHVDMSKYLDKVGVEVTFIFAGDHKVDGNPYEPLPEAVKADMQKSINTSYDAFTTLVADGREMDKQKIVDTQARTYRAADALSLGLIDAVATPSQAVLALLDELSGSNTQLSAKEPEMADQETKPGADQASTQQSADKAAADARTAERARIAGIQSCEEAKGREKLASHLALNTSMSVDEAKAILAAAPVETQQAAAKTENPFKQAMDASKHPEVGADQAANAGDEESAATAAKAILGNFSLATGRSFDKK